MAETDTRYLEEGTVLCGRYVIIGKLGAGGFGVTYHVREKYTYVEYAVKEYFPHKYATHNRFGKVVVPEEEKEKFQRGKERFREEGQNLKKLNGYRSLVTIVDTFDENQTTYIVMEKVGGRHLGDVIKDAGGRLPQKEVLSITYQICDGLIAMHEYVGLLHRDISPDNIMLTDEGDVKLIDFGNAKNISEKGNDIIFRKGEYTPYEQLKKGAEQGSYTDVYSLAVTVYYALTGMYIPMVLDRTAGETYKKLKDYPLGISESVSDAIDMALEIKPENRTQTIRAFKEQLQLSPEEWYGAVKEPYFEIVSGEYAGLKCAMPANQTITAGRSSRHADYCIGSNIQISKIHFDLSYDEMEGCFYLNDRSKNGIYIEKKRINKQERVRLEIDQKFVLGNNICEVKVGVLSEE